MLKTRFKKLTGLHAGHVYEVIAPANEMDSHDALVAAMRNCPSSDNLRRLGA